VPVCNFNSSNYAYEVCSGNSILFKDYSTNGAVSAYSWSATGSATLATPSASSTLVYFPSAGSYTVSLQVQNSAGSSSSSKTVNVLNGAANYTTNYVESFETSGATQPANWTITNPDAGVTWTKYTGVGSNGSNSFYIEGQNNPAGAEDFMTTGIFDLQANPTASITFDVSYARASSSHNDIFKVQASKDCEATWTDLYVPSMPGLASQTGGVSPGGFTPIVTQWKTVELHNYPGFNSFVGQPSVIFRFYFKEDNVSGFGNRIFIDNLNFTASAVGMNELTAPSDYVIYPNPASGSASLRYTLTSAAKVGVIIYDVRGSVLQEIPAMQFNPGEHSVPLYFGAEVADGLYFVELKINDLKLVKKLIVR
jgi:hypothetical protein